MNEDNKWKSIVDNPLVKWASNIEKRQSAINTLSSFGIALVVYTAVQGFTNPDFSIFDLLSFVGLFVAIASGFGVMAVQNDAINKAIMYFENNNELFKKYNKDSVDKSYKVRDSEFQRKFTKKLNNVEFKEKLEQETTKKINSIKDDLFKINNTLTTLSKKREIKTLHNKRTRLEDELKDLEENGINPQLINFTMYEPSDIFSFNDGEAMYGADKVKDNSKIIHTRKNIWARFYIPIITTIVTSGLLYLLSESLIQTLISTGTFSITLLWVWYNTYSKHIELKKKTTIPATINRNTLLNDAYNEFINITPNNGNDKNNEHTNELQVIKLPNKAVTIDKEE